MTIYAAEIRDKAFEIIDSLGLFAASRVVPTFQWQPEDAPAIAVYLRRDRMMAEGDPNAGEPSFMHSATIGISILTRAKDSKALVYVTDEPVNIVLTELLTRPDFLSLFEAITEIDQQPFYAPNASAYITETRIEMTVSFRSDWPPQVDDEYRGANLTTRPIGAGAQTPAIKTRIPAPTA